MNKGPFEAGVKPQQGKRHDLDCICDCVKAGKRNTEILEECGAKAARFEKQINFFRFTYDEIKSDRQLQGVRVIVIWGPTGTGKTYSAINYIANKVDYFIVEAPARGTDKVWFNGYEGQKTLIMDDFSGNFCNIEYLKRLLDHYKLKVEIKGGYVWACWTTVVITSNQAPSDWYTASQFNHVKQADVDALERRISEVRYQELRGCWKLDNFKGEQHQAADFNEYTTNDDDVIVIPSTPE